MSGLDDVVTYNGLFVCKEKDVVIEDAVVFTHHLLRDQQHNNVHKF